MHVPRPARRKTRSRRPFVNVADAAYSVVHDYPGGSESLAPRMGMSAAILRNKVNPNTSTHHLTLVEAERLTGITGDMRIAHAFAASHGAVVVQLGNGDDASDMAVLEVMASLWSRSGALGTEVHGALADNVLTGVELKAIRAAAYAVQQQLLGLINRLEGMAEPEGRTDA